MLDFLVNEARDDRGQSLVEYALVVALVALLAIAGLHALGGKANNTLLAPSAQLVP